jgi:uncharacterized protein YndB with AHSA1/START domain
MAANAESEDLEVVLTRDFAAPRALLFAAWSVPQHLAAWWGPRGFTNRTEVDARPGGHFRITMIAADGTEYPMKGVYREVVPPERLVYTNDLSEHPEEWHDQIDPGRDRSKGRPALDPVTTVTFEERGERTRVTVRMRFATRAMRDSFVKMGMNGGWNQSFDRLTELLAR